jgi:hypothetical protein
VRAARAARRQRCGRSPSVVPAAQSNGFPRALSSRPPLASAHSLAVAAGPVTHQRCLHGCLLSNVESPRGRALSDSRAGAAAHVHVAGSSPVASRQPRRTPVRPAPAPAPAGAPPAEQCPGEDTFMGVQ